jgi:hypothetical protein
MGGNVRQRDVRGVLNLEFSSQAVPRGRFVKSFQRREQRRHTTELVIPQVEDFFSDTHSPPEGSEHTTLKRAAHL